MGGKTAGNGAFAMSMARYDEGDDEKSGASQIGDDGASMSGASRSGTPQDGDEVGTSRSMIPPPPRSRFASLPRLGMPSSFSGDAGDESTAPHADTVRHTNYTSAFRSPVKGGNTSASVADTPSRLARFRETNWAAKDAKKRPRDIDSESAIQPPRSRTATRLFAVDGPRESPASSQEDATGDTTSKTTSTAAVAASANRTGGTLMLGPVEGEQEEPRALDREMEIAFSLHQDLLRDRARLELKKDSLTEEIDFYFSILLRIEQAAASARVTVERSNGTGSADVARISALANGLQHVISAERQAVPHASSTSPGSDGRNAAHPVFE